MKRILIADDDADLREILALSLGDSFEVVLASNGFEAIRWLEREAFDALLLDLSMPVLDGHGVIREMRRRHIAVPVVILSGEIELSKIARALEVEDFLAKPVRIDALKRALERVIAPQVRAHSGVVEVEA